MPSTTYLMVRSAPAKPGRVSNHAPERMQHCSCPAFLSALVSLYRHKTGDTGLASQYAWVLFSLAAVFFTDYFPGSYRARAFRQSSARTLT